MKTRWFHGKEFHISDKDYVNLQRILKFSRPWNAMGEWFEYEIMYHLRRRRISETYRWMMRYPINIPLYSGFIPRVQTNNRREERAKKCHPNSFRKKSKEEQKALARAQKSQQRRKKKK